MAKKKTYYIPTTQVVKIEGLYPLAIGDTSGHGNMAPQRRDAETNASVF